MCHSFVNYLYWVYIRGIVPMCSLTALSFQFVEHPLCLLWGHMHAVCLGCVVNILNLVCLIVLIVYEMKWNEICSLYLVLKFLPVCPMYFCWQPLNVIWYIPLLLYLSVLCFLSWRWFCTVLFVSHAILMFEFLNSLVIVKVKVTLRPTISRPVHLGVRRPSETRDQFFYLLEIF
jgi:hypothetical protein